MINRQAERESNIELLRIIAMAFVIFLHYFNAGMGGASKFVAAGSAKEIALYILESIGICAVDLFVMISGYFLSRSNHRTIGHAVILLIQTSVYRVCYYLILCLIKHAPVLPSTLFKMVLPANWFVILYVCMYLASPLLNHAFQSAKSKKKALILLIILFSVWASTVDLLQRITGLSLDSLSTLGMYGSERGYTIVNFFLCYLVGAFLNEIDLKRIKSYALIIFLAADVALITVWSFWDAETAREYCNPFVIAEAAAAILLFLKMDLGRSKVINRISAAAFSVYIIHSWLFPLINIEKYVQMNLGVMLIHIALSIVLIITAVFIIDLLYKLIMQWFNNRVKSLGRYEL